MPIFKGLIVKVPTKKDDFEGVQITEEIIMEVPAFPARDEDHARAILISKVFKEELERKVPQENHINFEDPFIEVRIRQISTSGSRPSYYDPY